MQLFHDKKKLIHALSDFVQCTFVPWINCTAVYSSFDFVRNLGMLSGHKSRWHVLHTHFLNHFFCQDGLWLSLLSHVSDQGKLLKRSYKLHWRFLLCASSVFLKACHRRGCVNALRKCSHRYLVGRTRNYSFNLFLFIWSPRCVSKCFHNLLYLYR